MKKTAIKKLALLILIIIVSVFNLSVNLNSESKFKPCSEIYRVHKGENFWSISSYYREKDARNPYLFEYQDELRKLNPWLVERKNQLKPNDKLIIRYYKQN